MVDNFDRIIPLLSFDSGEEFYFIQVIKRRKDNPDLSRDAKTIKNFYVYKDEIEILKPKIIEVCDYNHARAYINLNRRNIQKMALLTLQLMTKYIVEGNYRAAPQAFDSACGKHHQEPNKTFLIDCDTDNSRYINTCIQIASSCQGFEDYSDTQKFVPIPTLNGYHLITRPFNTKEFRDKAQDKLDPIPDIQINNPTLLYFND